MSIFEDEILNSSTKHIPDLQLAQSIFLLENGFGEDEEGLKASILGSIEEDKMAPLYGELCERLGWEKDEGLEARLRQENEEELNRLEEKKGSEEENAGDMEVIDVLFEKARFLSRIGSRDAFAAFDAVIETKKTTSGKRIDAHMEKARLHLFFMDLEGAKASIDLAKELNDKGGDWDRRNRLKVYEGVYFLATRDIQSAASLLLDCVSTFTCLEICSYEQFMAYMVLANTLHLPRTRLREEVIQSPAVIAVLKDAPFLTQLVSSLYDCEYDAFMEAVLHVHPMVLHDRYLSGHTSFLVRELRVLSYSQFLEAYKSITLESMACSFGVTAPFLDRELSRFIASGRLSAKINKVDDVVESSQVDKRNAQYAEVIKKGDGILNRIQ
jgi:26S proteasome regulatory subunit N7